MIGAGRSFGYIVRTVAWLVVICVVFTIGYALWSGFDSWADTKAAHENLRWKSARLDQEIAAMSGKGLALADPSRDVYRGDFLNSASDELAYAELQARVKDAALRRRIEVRSARAIDRITLDELPYLGVRVAFSGELPDVRAVLYDLEFGTPVLSVRRVVVRNDGPNLPRMDPSAAGRLMVELDVFGARWPATSRTKEPRP